MVNMIKILKLLTKKTSAIGDIQFRININNINY